MKVEATQARELAPQFQRRATMELYNWDAMEEEEITPLLTRRYISGKSMTMGRIILRKGCIVQAHRHENEQLSTVITGAMKFIVDGEEIIVRAGETLVIPANALHSAEALEDTDNLDVFSPIRSDWIEGRDGYLRGK
jgi:quercetin dioxygenase-like cupin family protein